MRVWILSDLHIEQCRWDLPDPAPNFDLLIAAGDIHDALSDGVRWLAERANGRPVIYVPGNHEWYAHPSPSASSFDPPALCGRSVDACILQRPVGSRRGVKSRALGAWPYPYELRIHSWQHSRGLQSQGLWPAIARWPYRE